MNLTNLLLVLALLLSCGPGYDSHEMSGTYTDRFGNDWNLGITGHDNGCLISLFSDDTYPLSMRAQNYTTDPETGEKTPVGNSTALSDLTSKSLSRAPGATHFVISVDTASGTGLRIECSWDGWE